MAETQTQTPEVDYTLNNPDTLTKYKTAAQISHKVVEAVSALCVEGAKIVEICQQGDKLLDEELSKVYKGKKITKGIGHPTTVSPSSYVTPYTPLVSDTQEAETTLKAGEIAKIQLGAQIDGFGTIVCDMVVVGASEVTGREADLIHATYYANELLLRLMAPPGLLATGDEESKKKAAAEKPPTQARISQLIEKIAKVYDCNVVENTTSWLFERNEIEAEKKIILSPGSGVMRGEGVPDVGEVWGVEVGLSLGSGKVKTLDHRSTLHRRTTTTYQLKRPSSRQVLSEVVKKFGQFPFSLRQLEDEKAAKVGVLECVRGGVLRQYEPAGEADNSAVSRYLTTIAITKNGITKLAAPATPDFDKIKSDKKIEDTEILNILGLPLSKSTGSKNKNKKKKPAKKADGAQDEE
ncbi:peptidase M24, structural domain-containing protein [Aspergillus aurantiobrunneus]